MNWNNKFLNSINDFLEAIKHEFEREPVYTDSEIKDFIYFFKKQIEKESISQEDYDLLEDENKDFRKENEYLEEQINDLENEIYDLRRELENSKMIEL
jgi:SMC interacting uncharacterized protein involved in chromosome segregation